MSRPGRDHHLGWLLSSMLAVVAQSACTARSTPEHPTWSDVEPILRAECLGCHGGSAPSTGSVPDATGAPAIIYRFDFYDLTPAICGEAASAVDVTRQFAAGFAKDDAQTIAEAITVDPDHLASRPRMPPAPATPLAEWEWQTILRWTAGAPDAGADEPVPEKGPAPLQNRAPVVSLSRLNRTADKRVSLSANLEDPDGHSAVGVLTIGTFTLRMDRPGIFAADIDTSKWLEGDTPVQAVVCDGWTTASYNLGTIAITHE